MSAAVVAETVEVVTEIEEVTGTDAVAAAEADRHTTVAEEEAEADPHQETTEDLLN